MKYKKWFKTKKWLAAILSASLIFSVMSVPAFAAQKLYDQVTQEVVTKGVTYEYNHRLTDEGWQDIHVLKIQLDDPNVVVQPIESQTDLGLKETVLKMITDSGAAAGVNSDFFGMKGTYSASFGPVIKDGKVVSMGTDRNLGTNEYSTFFLDTEGNPFIDFFRVTADFYANTNSHLELASINKATEMIYPICFTREAGSTTETLDARFPDLVKFVVDNNVITKISQKGEIVEVPENGYVIILSGEHYDGVAEYFTVGQNTELKIQPSLDLSKIKTAISGVGRILVDGELPSEPGLIITGRQPRTALGISQDKNTLILMVVDGRTHSIGATQNEMAAFMKEYGAYNAMHFDGGGSTTMVVKTVEDPQPEVKNTVSDGAQRKVMNSLGVFNNGPQGPVEHIVLKPDLERVFVGNSVKMNAIGYDAYYHRQEVAADAMNFTVPPEQGTFETNVFTPSSAGNVTVEANYNGITAQTTIEVMEPAVLTPSITSIQLSQAGETASIGFSGKSTDGFEASVTSGVIYELSDPNLGTIDGGTFVAANQGSGTLKCTFGNAVCYIPISVGAAGGTVDTPVTPQITDPKKTAFEKADDGAYYINIIGRVSSGTVSDTGLYESERTKAKSFVEKDASLAVYGGKNDINSAPSVDTIKWDGNYQFSSKNNTSIVQLTAANGGIRNTFAAQWISFVSDINNAGNNNVIFIMDKTPSDFSDAMETALFRSALETMRKSGKNIFVISSGGGYWSNLKDGIRYINLPDLWTADGKINNDFTKLKIRVNGNQVIYDTVKMY